jgi:hypothetical protein
MSAVAFLAILSGCGSAPSTGSTGAAISPAEFVAKADAACAAVDERAQPALSLLTGLGSTAEQNSLVAFAGLVRDLRTRLGAIPAPSNKQAEYARGLYLLSKLASDVEAFHSAAVTYFASGDRNGEQMGVAESEMEKTAEALDSTASALGLTGCARIAHAQIYGEAAQSG